MVGFYRRAVADRTGAEIARWVRNLAPLPLGAAVLAPRVCGACRGVGRNRPGYPCPLCDGQCTLRRFDPQDPGLPVLVQGPCGTGRQRLVALALADGRPAYAHIVEDGETQVRLYTLPPAVQRAGGRLRLASAR